MFHLDLEGLELILVTICGVKHDSLATIIMPFRCWTRLNLSINMVALICSFLSKGLMLKSLMQGWKSEQELCMPGHKP